MATSRTTCFSSLLVVPVARYRAPCRRRNEDSHAEYRRIHPLRRLSRPIPGRCGRPKVVNNNSGSQGGRGVVSLSSLAPDRHRRAGLRDARAARLIRRRPSSSRRLVLLRSRPSSPSLFLSLLRVAACRKSRPAGVGNRAPSRAAACRHRRVNNIWTGVGGGIPTPPDGGCRTPTNEVVTTSGVNKTKFLRPRPMFFFGLRPVLS